MGDLRYTHPYRRLVEAEKPLDVLRALPDDDVIAALAAASRENDPYLANVLATEAQNRTRRATVIARTLGEGVVAIDRAGRVTFINDAAARMLATAPEAALGRDVIEVLGPRNKEGDLLTAEEAPILAALQQGATVHREDVCYSRGSDRDLFPVSLTATPIFHDGEVEGAVVVFQDITERYRYEAALQASERLKASIVSSALDCIITIDDRGRVLEWNPAAEETFGYPAAQAMGREISELIIPPSYREAHRRGMARHGATGEGPILNRRIEMPAMRADGTEFPAELAIVELPVAAGRRYTAYLRDITGLKQAERERERLLAAERSARARAEEAVREREASLVALAESRERYRSLFEENPDPVFTLDLLGSFLEVNPACERLSGYTSREILGRPFLDFVIPEDAPRAIERFLEVLAGDTQTNEFTIRTRDGRLRHVMVTGVPMRVGGELAGMHAIAKDITERREAEEALRESEQLFRSLAENLPDIVWVSPPSGATPVYVNPAFERIFGRPVEVILRGERAWLKSLHPDDRERVGEAYDCFLRGEGEYDVEYRIVRPDGGLRWIRDHATVVLDEEGNRVQLVGIAEDITRQKDVEAALRADEARLGAVFDLAREGLVITDVEGRYQVINRAARALLGLAAEAPAVSLEELPYTLLSPEGLPLPPERFPFTRTLRQGEVVEDEPLLLERDDGSQVAVAVSTTPLRDPRTGEITGAVASLRELPPVASREAPSRYSR
ncbi:MAG TPA: PAS domain S-box protein [Candidatus Thermoplasmatota archaeon]|nr:PAS domain S-box protein [Candidatus Thermoplasmatota archaeon]